MEFPEQENQPRRRLDFEHNESGIVCETTGSLHSKISEEIIPKIDLEFETEQVAYDFYNAYALAIGFSIRKGTVHKHMGTVLDRTFVCSCQGTRPHDKREAYYKSCRPETRFGCLAMLKINCRQTGNFRVVSFIAEHNHNLVSPRKAHLFRSHQKVSSSQALEVDMADMSGIAPKKAYDLMARQAGGRENLGFVQEDLKNYLRKKRSLQMRSGDTGGVLEYLQSMREEDPNFFYAIQVDEDDLITNIFWVDAKMAADYEDFGDAVCFDTTYRKYEDGRPIGLFVGVNHHKQTTIFGATLLYDETSESFVWLYDTFARAMGGKLPKTMLTDQDAAMSKAIAFPWPGTSHRLCIWHIFQNAATHLHHYFATYKDFSRDFSRCIYDYEHEEDFLDAWSKMLDTYGLQDNAWLHRMFNIKEKWALVYGRDSFCADMSTTQRSASMNKLIKHYVNYKHTMRRFFEHFQRLLNDRRYDEMVADFKASQSKVTRSLPAEILNHASVVYTPEVYKLFEKELGKSIDCLLEFCGGMEGGPVQYKITPLKMKYSYVVYYYEAHETTYCSCRKFEFVGLFCCHILKVLSSKGITKIPIKYILKRWTNNAKKGSTGGSSENLISEADPKKARGWRYKELCRLSTRLVTRAAETEEGFVFVKEGLAKLMNGLDSSSMGKPIQSSSQNCPNAEADPNCYVFVTMNENVIKKTAQGIKLKPKSGNKSSKRIRSALETATKKNKRSKKSISIDPQGSQHAQLNRVDLQQQSIYGDIIPWDPSRHNFSPSGYGHNILSEILEEVYGVILNDAAMKI